VVCCTDELGVSSLHMTFTQPVEAQELQQLGYLRRTGIQYHWCGASDDQLRLHLLCNLAMRAQYEFFFCP